MKIIKTQFEGLKIIKNPKIYDNRGYFREISAEKLIRKRLKFNYTSLSKKNVVRGLHLQNKKKQAKLITVLSGKIKNFW
jgi:dTDP-4-dehydrorhamnose 3,5-epimerase